MTSGRFEVVTGALVMTDEGLGDIASMHDQLLEGHLWLKHELGKPL